MSSSSSYLFPALSSITASGGGGGGDSAIIRAGTRFSLSPFSFLAVEESLNLTFSLLPDSLGGSSASQDDSEYIMIDSQGNNIFERLVSKELDWMEYSQL